MKTNKGYVFLSHSSKDIVKVRKIRNIIEDEGGNPILFYLKCLDNDSPENEDEQLLKSLISKEIRARKKFILCESSNTKCGMSKYIDWEIEEVTRLEQNCSGEIQIEKINIEDTNEEVYHRKVEEFVFKQDRILLVATLEDREHGCVISNYLFENNLNIVSRIETEEMRRDNMYIFGHRVKEHVKSMLEEVLPRGIVIRLVSNKSSNNTYMQMVTAILQKSFIINIDATHDITQTALEELKNKITEYINC